MQVAGMWIFFFFTLFVSFLCFLLHAILKYFTIEMRCFHLNTSDILRYLELAACVSLWYSISISFTLFNKYFSTIWFGGFHFIIFTTFVHMTIKLLLSQLWGCLTQVLLTPIPWKLFGLLVIPIGITTALDIMLSNLSLQTITVTNYTLLKSSVLIWTFFWAVVIGANTFSWRTLLSILVISLGLTLAVLQPTRIEVLGTLLVLGASAAAGMRWALLQLLILKDPLSRNLFGSIYRFSPASVLTVLPLAVFFDLEPLSESIFVQDGHLFLLAMGLMIVSGVLAFGLIVVEVKLVQLTDSVTLSVLGQAKELVQITLAGLVFGDALSGRV